MKELALWVSAPYAGDRIFDPSSPLNRDDCLSSARMLRALLRERGWDCHTQDHYLAAGDVPDAVLFNDIPGEGVRRALGPWYPRVRKFAVLLECEAIKPENWRSGAHEPFEAVFTWDERYVDDRKYFKANFSVPFPSQADSDPAGRPGFCVMITANKSSRHPLELYSERKSTVRWFERNRPGKLDLYGMGWERRLFEGPLRPLNRLSPLTRLFAEKFPSYRGPVDRKLPVLRKYKFAICYENAREISGYITEKIFDALFAGCVPVYWGAPDIARFVPESCFIDRRRFRDNEELCLYMEHLQEDSYLGMLSAAAEYVRGAGTGPFSDRAFAAAVAGRICAG